MIVHLSCGQPLKQVIICKVYVDLVSWSFPWFSKRRSRSDSKKRHSLEIPAQLPVICTSLKLWESGMTLEMCLCTMQSCHRFRGRWLTQTQHSTQLNPKTHVVRLWEKTGAAGNNWHRDAESSQLIIRQAPTTPELATMRAFTNRKML